MKIFAGASFNLLKTFEEEHNSNSRIKVKKQATSGIRNWNWGSHWQSKMSKVPLLKRINIGKLCEQVNSCRALGLHTLLLPRRLKFQSKRELALIWFRCKEETTIISLTTYITTASSKIQTHHIDLVHLGQKYYTVLYSGEQSLVCHNNVSQLQLTVSVSKGS